MNFLKIACDGETNDYVHNQFTRFGLGEYNRFLIGLQITKKNLKVRGSWDIAGMLALMIADLIEGTVSVSGKIIANYDFESELGFESKFGKRGKLYTAEIKKEMSKEELKELVEKYKMQFLLLNINAGEIKMKSKGSLPKPGGTLKDNFCSASLPLEMVDEFAWDFDKDFNKATIIHKLIITDLEIPKGYENDFAQARIKAIRKGKVIRVIDIDGKEVEKEYRLSV